MEPGPLPRWGTDCNEMDSSNEARASPSFAWLRGYPTALPGLSFSSAHTAGGGGTELPGPNLHVNGAPGGNTTTV